MICSTLTGKLSILHPVINRFVREDGLVLNRTRGSSKTPYKYTEGSTNYKGYKTMRFNVHSNNPLSLNVHRLVAECFIPNPENKPEVDHINRVRHDNRAVNLRWVTSKENNANRSRYRKRS